MGRLARPEGIVYGPPMAGQNSVAVIGAGIVGSAVAYALAREGRRVLLFDRGEPGVCGASFGNAGHIATESVEPLPSVELLLGFWRQLFAFGGPLDIPFGRLPALAPFRVIACRKPVFAPPADQRAVDVIVLAVERERQQRRAGRHDAPLAARCFGPVPQLFPGRRFAWALVSAPRNVV